jgi:hypothetical protein
MIAFAAASLFAAACGSKAPDQGTTPAAAPEKTAAAVHCMGINSCKGTGSCKSEKNGCKGQNNCKAMGMTDTATAEECTTKGGTVAAGN